MKSAGKVVTLRDAIALLAEWEEEDASLETVLLEELAPELEAAPHPPESCACALFCRCARGAWAVEFDSVETF